MTTPPTPSLTDRLVSALESLLDAEEKMESANDFEAWADYPKPCFKQIDAQQAAQKLWFRSLETARTLLAEARATPPAGALDTWSVGSSLCGGSPHIRTSVADIATINRSTKQRFEAAQAICDAHNAACGVGAWVPVGERLPDNDKPVIGWNGSAWPARCINGLWYKPGTSFRINVTHWQPLPAGPDAQREDDCGITGLVIKPSTKGEA